MLTPLSRQDYPNITYWYEGEFNEASQQCKKIVDLKGKRGPRRANEGENVMCWYLEDTSGTMLIPRDVKLIRHESRNLWRVLYEESSGTLESPWGRVHPKLQSRFYEEMERKFFCLRLCHGCWKVKKICTQGYSQWYTAYTKPKGPLKNEQLEEEAEPVCPAKRPIDDPLPTPGNKRSNTVPCSSSPSPSPPLTQREYNSYCPNASTSTSPPNTTLDQIDTTYTSCYVFFFFFHIYNALFRD